MKPALVLPLLALFCSCTAVAVTKVACVGDSITFGAGLAPTDPRYPTVLAQLLGDQFEVKNFGNSGKTAGDFPSQKSKGRWYGDTKEHKEAVNFKADVYICNLGINDTGAWWDPSLFKTGYDTLAKAWKNANPKAELFAWGLLGPDFRGPLGQKAFPGNVFAPGSKYSTTDNGSSTNRETAEKLIREVAKQNKIRLFDAYTPLANHPEWNKDGLHPTAPGAKRIAEITFAKLASDLAIPMPLPQIKGEEKSVTISNPGTSALLLDGWALSPSNSRKPVYLFGNQTVIAPGEEISVSLEPQATESENDPSKALICKTAAKGTALKLLPPPTVKPAGKGTFCFRPKKVESPVMRTVTP